VIARNKRNRDFAETRTPLGVIGGFVGFLAASVAAATLVTVGMTPALATVGIAASGTIGIFENLPGYLQIGELSEKSNIYATRSDGSVALLASFYDQNRVEVGWDQISQYVKDAAVAGEDPRFYEHGGVDLQGTIRAAVTTATGRQTQGGSSIAQQYVKNIRVQECEREAADEEERAGCYEAVTETTIDRKLKEMRLAIGVEKRYSKSEILLGYLNIAGFGGTVYGIEALLQHLGREPHARAGGIAHGDRQQPGEVPARSS
jgi:membrane peptidoglycan carboxypeptidase